MFFCNLYIWFKRGFQSSVVYDGACTVYSFKYIGQKFHTHLSIDNSTPNISLKRYKLGPSILKTFIEIEKVDTRNDFRLF